MLKLRNITKTYITGDLRVNALHNVSLDFRRNEFVSILGQSGCGKTTMLNLIGGLDRYSSGDLIIDGKSTKDFKNQDWDAYRNHCIGYVFQSYNLIPHLTVLGNVELALTISGESITERRKRAANALEKVGLGNQLNKRPNQLSGGQMQRVAIARALVNDPQIILADEPTGALDSKTSVQIMELLKEVAADRLVILVTHNNELAETYSTRIVKLSDGEISGDTRPVTEDEQIQMAESQGTRGSLWKPAKEKPQEKQAAAAIETEQGKDTKPQKKEKVKIKRTSMSFFTALNLSFRNLWSKRGRTFMVSFAGSIGIIGIALVLAISNGFSLYINKIETETLASFPISISKIGVDMESLQNGMMDGGEQAPEFPDSTDVRFVETQDVMDMISKTNTITKEFIEYLDGIKDLKSDSSNYRGQTVALDVQKSYAINMPLVTTYDRTGAVKMVGTRSSSSGMGSMFGGGSDTAFTEMLDNPDFMDQQYDVLQGAYPANYKQIALVVDETNGISKKLAKNLGFNENLETVDFSKIVGKKYKIVLNDAYYTTDQAGKTIQRIDTDDKDDLDEIYKRADGDGVIELTISGIMRVRPDAVLAMYGSGLVYLPSLTEKYLESCTTAEVATMQAAALDLSGTAGINAGEAQIYKALFGDLEDDFSYATEFYDGMKPMLDLMSVLPKQTQIDRIVESFNNGEMQSGDMAIISEILAEMGDNGIKEFATMLAYFGDSMKQFKDTTQATFGLPMYYFEQMMTGSFASVQEHKESVMQLIGIGGLPTSISIYPRSFETKKEIMAYLDKWNTNNPDNIITATDPAALLSSTMGQMIDIISYVLIAFAAVSLVVSSIMIGIITYVSVIERTKEIGVLRSIGARKKDIGNVFNAETVIIGFVAGMIGVLVAYLLCIPINVIIGMLAGSAVVGNLAVLNPLHALALVAISMVLTLISGLVPSSIASNRDPVVALRTE